MKPEAQLTLDMVVMRPPLQFRSSNDRLTPPDPWLLDTAHFLTSLARIRELALNVPLTNASYAPTNLVVDAVWDLESSMRFMIGLRESSRRAGELKA